MTPNEANLVMTAMRASDAFKASNFNADRITDDNPEALRIRLIVSGTTREKASAMGQAEQKLTAFAEQTLGRKLAANGGEISLQFSLMPEEKATSPMGR